MNNTFANLVLAIAACVCLFAQVQSTEQPDFARGWRLHDDACTGCHGPSMYSRPAAERNPYFTVRKQVEIWQDFIGIGWNERDIADVAHYVQKRFYEKRCPDRAC